MKLLVGILIMTAALLSVASSQVILPPPSVTCSCPTTFNPVCGTDGNTYGNLCLLKCISDDRVMQNYSPVFLHYNYRCPPEPCSCSTVFNPVCGNDILTYYNPCFLACENKRLQNLKLGLPNIGITKTGKCTELPMYFCPDTIVPICGTDNVTYRNFCFLKLASHFGHFDNLPPVFFQSAGPCKTESCNCSSKYKPVCADNDETFDNQCLLDCANRLREILGETLLTVKHYGACRHHKLPALTVQYPGAGGCSCNYNYDPVCGTDGKTYGNICLLQCEIKRRQNLGLKPITLAYYGTCICNCSYCSTVYNPVCGSDGKTYWNYCWLQCTSKCNVNNNLPKITVVNFGDC